MLHVTTVMVRCIRKAYPELLPTPPTPGIQNASPSMGGALLKLIMGEVITNYTFKGGGFRLFGRARSSIVRWLS